MDIGRASTRNADTETRETETYASTERSDSTRPPIGFAPSTLDPEE